MNKQDCMQCGAEGAYPACEPCQRKLKALGLAIKQMKREGTYVQKCAAYLINNIGFKSFCDMLGEERVDVEERVLAFYFDDVEWLVGARAQDIKNKTRAAEQAFKALGEWDDPN